MSSKSKYSSILLFLIILIVVAMFIKNRTSQSDPSAGQPLILDARKKGVDWEKLPFVSVSDTNKLNEYLRNIQITGDELLSTDQREKIYSSFLLLAQAYSVGTYEAYMRFRLPAGAKYERNETFIDIWLPDWKPDDPDWLQEYPDSKVVVPEGEEFHRWVVRKGSKGTFFKDCWKGVCVDPEKIYAKLGTANSSGDIVKAGIYVDAGGGAKKTILETTTSDYQKIKKSTFNAGGGVAFCLPAFLFHCVPQENDVNIDDSWRSLSFYFFVKAGSNDPVIPVYLFLFWDKEINEWVPVALLSGNLLARLNLTKFL